MDTRYRLKKNLPCAEVGEIFQQGYDETQNKLNIVVLMMKTVLLVMGVLNQLSRKQAQKWEH